MVVTLIEASFGAVQGWLITANLGYRPLWEGKLVGNDGMLPKSV